MSSLPKDSQKLRCSLAIRTCALAMVLVICALTLCACGASSNAVVWSSTTGTADEDHQAIDPTINTTNSNYWGDQLAKYRNDDSVQQLLLVRYLGGCKATTQYFIKSPEESNAWTLIFEDDSLVGRDGLGEASSTTAVTPAGDYAITEAFGIKNNPGTALPYILVTDTIYGSCECSEDCEYFNTIHDIAVNGHTQCDGEHMIEYSPQYNYGLNFDYNSEKIPSKGSAFFIHCKGVKPYTGGCIALDEDHMKTILQTATPGMRVVIGNN